MKEEELYPRIGLDGIIFLRLIDIGIQVTFILLVLLAIPLAVLYMCSHDWSQDSDDSKSYSWFDYIAIDMLPSHSHWFLAPVIASFVLTWLATTILMKHHRDVVQWRYNSLVTDPAPGVQYYSVLVRDIPSKKGIKPVRVQSTQTLQQIFKRNEVRDDLFALWENVKLSFHAVCSSKSMHKGGAADVPMVKRFFKDLYIHQDVQVLLVPEVDAVKSALTKRDVLQKVLRGTTDSSAEERKQLQQEWESAGMSGPAPSREAKFKQIESSPRTLEEGGSLLFQLDPDHVRDQLALEYDAACAQVAILRDEAANKTASSAFVKFSTIRAAAICSQVLHTMDTHDWVAEHAPHPADIDWRTVSMSWWDRYIRGLCTPILSFLINIFFLFPVTVVSGMSTINNLKNAAPWLEPLVDIPVIADFLEGYLPGLSLTLALMAVPHIFKWLAYYRGVHTNNLQTAEAIYSTFFLFVVDVLLGSSFISAVMDNLDDLIDSFSTSKFLRTIGFSVPDGAYFFIVLICAKMGTGLASELMQIVKILKTNVGLQSIDTVQQPPFMSNIPWILFVFLLCTVYATVSPLLVPFALCYFLFNKFLWRNQLLFVYAPTCDTKGSLWPYYMRVFMYSLIMAQVFLAGVLLTKTKTFLMMVELGLSLITYLYWIVIADGLKSFQEVPLELAHLMDEKSELNRKELDINAFTHPAMRDIPVVKPVQKTEYGSTETESPSKVDTNSLDKSNELEVARIHTGPSSQSA